MGLFGSIFKIGASLIGGGKAKKASKKAQAAQLAAINSGMGEINSSFAQSRAEQLPFLQSGTSALGALGDLLGLNGGEAQASSIASLRESPQFESLFRTGEEAILQNASATGGLRGGNLQRGLADFGSDTLSKVIENQLSRLGGLTQLGSSTASNLGAMSADKAAAITRLFGQQGDVNAGGILQRNTISNNTLNTVAKEAGSLFDNIGSGGINLGSLKGLF